MSSHQYNNPRFFLLKVATLDVLSNGKTMSLTDIYESIIKYFQVNKHLQQEVYISQNDYVFKNRIRFVLNQLLKEGTVDRPYRGNYKITNKGAIRNRSNLNFGIHDGVKILFKETLKSQNNNR